MRKQLGAPDENRKKAKKLFGDEPSFDDFDESDGGVENGSKPENGTKKASSDATAYAMKLLAARAYTERGLREKLQKREFSQKEIDAAVEYVRGFGYINDARLVQLVAEKAAAKLWGLRKIYPYLRSKGFSSEVIDGVDFSEIDFKENCKALAEKYKRKGASKEKIMRALANAGFSGAEIRYALGS